METCWDVRTQEESNAKKGFPWSKGKTCHKHENPQTPAIKIPDDNKIEMKVMQRNIKFYLKHIHMHDIRLVMAQHA